MPGPKKSRVPVEKLTVTLPQGMYQEVIGIINVEHGWLSAIDFIREATKEKVDRWKSAGHRLPEGPSPADLVEEVRARRAAETPERRRAP